MVLAPLGLAALAREDDWEQRRRECPAASKESAPGYFSDRRSYASRFTSVFFLFVRLYVFVGFWLRGPAQRVHFISLAQHERRGATLFWLLRWTGRRGQTYRAPGLHFQPVFQHQLGPFRRRRL